LDGSGESWVRKVEAVICNTSGGFKLQHQRKFSCEDSQVKKEKKNEEERRRMKKKEEE